MEILSAASVAALVFVEVGDLEPRPSAETRPCDRSADHQRGKDGDGRHAAPPGRGMEHPSPSAIVRRSRPARKKPAMDKNEAEIRLLIASATETALGVAFIMADRGLVAPDKVEWLADIMTHRLRAARDSADTPAEVSDAFDQLCAKIDADYGPALALVRDAARRTWRGD